MSDQTYLEAAKKAIVEQYNVYGIGTPRGEAVNKISQEDLANVSFNVTDGWWLGTFLLVRPSMKKPLIYIVTADIGAMESDTICVDTYLYTHTTTHKGING